MAGMTTVHYIRSGAAALSELLAAGALDDAELEQAARLLNTYRRARMELDRAGEDRAEI